MYRTIATVHVKLKGPRAENRELFVPSIFRDRLRNELGGLEGKGGLVDDVYVSTGRFDLMVHVYGRYKRSLPAVLRAIYGMKGNYEGWKAVDNMLVFDYC